MLKRYASLGVSLTREEMKAVKGGSALAATLWECYIEANQPFFFCLSANPVGYCGYPECYPVGTCAPTNICF